MRVAGDLAPRLGFAGPRPGARCWPALAQAPPLRAASTRPAGAWSSDTLQAPSRAFSCFLPPPSPSLPLISLLPVPPRPVASCPPSARGDAQGDLGCLNVQLKEPI